MKLLNLTMMAILTAMCCSSAMAAGQTFVVNNRVVSASDENPGTEARPLKTIQAEMPMENQDGTPLDITSDFFGKPITPGKILPGPIQAITPGRNVIEVWPKQAGSRSGSWRHDAPAAKGQ